MHKKAAAFLLVALLCKSLFGFELDRTQIAIQAKIYPQLIFFVSKNRELSPQKPIVVAAVYTEGTKRFAEMFKEECEKLYKGRIKGFSLQIKLVHKDKVGSGEDYNSCYVIFEDDDDTRVYASPKLRGMLTFAGNKRVFEKNGAMFFVGITNKTSILLNKKTLNASGISFDPSLLKIVRVYDE